MGNMSATSIGQVPFPVPISRIWRLSSRSCPIGDWKRGLSVVESRIKPTRCLSLSVVVNFHVYFSEEQRIQLRRFQIAAHPREHCSWMSRFLVLVLVGSISPVFLVSEGLVPADIIIRFKLTSEESGKWEVQPAAILHQPLVDGRANGCCFPIDRGSDAWSHKS